MKNAGRNTKKGHRGYIARIYSVDDIKPLDITLIMHSRTAWDVTPTSEGIQSYSLTGPDLSLARLGLSMLLSAIEASSSGLKPSKKKSPRITKRSGKR